MICPECRMENPAEAAECMRCGHSLSAPTQDVNQIWNTDIDHKQNQKNSRAALMALAVAGVLLIALLIALFVSASSTGDALIGQREDGQAFIERTEDFLETFGDWVLRSREPVPETYASIPDGPDREFVELFEEYLEKDYDDDYADSRLLSERYYEEFNNLKYENFTDGDLAVYAAQTVQALDKLRKGGNLTDDLEDTSTTHDILWMEGCVELYTVAEALYNRYGILYKDSHIPEYYIWLRPIMRAELEVEYDLTAQLIGVDAVISDNSSAPYLTYTNNTPFTFDITFYNDYETEDDYCYEECSFIDITPEETITIYLNEMPDEYENWYVDWYVDNCYYNGEDIYTYDW